MRNERLSRGEGDNGCLGVWVLVKIEDDFADAAALYAIFSWGLFGLMEKKIVSVYSLSNNTIVLCLTIISGGLRENSSEVVRMEDDFTNTL